jgi:SagB-type dehydrogenase family enzyme
MFRNDNPVAWTFHRNTSRWPHNTLSPEGIHQEAPAFKEMVDRPAVPLPPPAAPLGELGEAIRGRFSCRRFAGDSVSLPDAAALLYWSYGKLDVCHPFGTDLVHRPVPSGGGLYPLEQYVIAQRIAGLAPGIYHYNVLGHSLECVDAGAMPAQALAGLFLWQPYVAQSAFVIVLTAIFDRSLWKYRDRGYRYLLLEAGHVAQNANLVATALGQGSLNLGGFFDADMAGILNLDLEEEAPLYAVAIGQPEKGDADVLRAPDQPSDAL